MALTFKERDRAQARALELFTRAAEAILDPTIERCAASMLYGAQAILHVARIGGDDSYKKVRQVLENLLAEEDRKDV